MISSISDGYRLANGVMMPGLGLGTFRADGDILSGAIHSAAALGYRLIDTAAMYGNEKSVGEAISTSGVPRGEFFVTTKLGNKCHGYDNALAAFDESLRQLKMDYIDLYLIHWPLPAQDKYAETWKALCRIYDEGRARVIGVCNFYPEYLLRCADETGRMPMVNQVECHPCLQQRELKAFCRENGVQLEAYSPLLEGHLEEAAGIEAIAEKHGKSLAQVCIRWQIENGVAVMPKSANAGRIAENADVFDFSLDAEDMRAIEALDRGYRRLPDPRAMG